MNQNSEEFQQWQEMMQDLNEQVSDAVEQNLEAQTTFMQSWLDTVSQVSEDAPADDAVEGYRQAYETWMNAAEDTIAALSETDDEEVSPSEFRDIWLDAANESFKEIMRTTAFASMTGETVEGLLDLKRQRDEAAEAALHDLGLPAKGDLREVGERLVELERRQHEVEQQLDRVLETLEA